MQSARYAGEEKSFQKNIEKLLAKLEGKEDRRAQFRTVICLIQDGKEHFFEGVSKGRILAAQKGLHCFVYDPVFVPDEEDRTFAEMSLEEKNRFSHRRRAVDQLVLFLSQSER